jgi:hypothetical protein
MTKSCPRRPPTCELWVGSRSLDKPCEYDRSREGLQNVFSYVRHRLVSINLRNHGFVDESRPVHAHASLGFHFEKSVVPVVVNPSFRTLMVSPSHSEELE